MSKILKRLISVILCVTLLSSVPVVVMPTASAAEIPAGVTYTEAEINKGKYLVAVECVKYNPVSTEQPQAILSEAGDISITYRPKNGTAPEQTEKFEGVIPANAFAMEGAATVPYYFVLDGFPQDVTVSCKKTNSDENDSGIYVRLKVWNVALSDFQSVVDSNAIQYSNGSQTNQIMFSTISSLNLNYPYAKEGSVASNNLTLPAGLDANEADQNFNVYDQWGVMMVAPDITYTPVTGLTFSQDGNVMKIKGTGDANNVSANTRTVTLSATYETSNTAVINNYSISKNITITNSSPLTYAPTFANREKAGLGIKFQAGGKDVEKFVLDSSYKKTTNNSVVLTNNCSRTARVIISTKSDKYILPSVSSVVIAAGQSASVTLNAGTTAANANYNADMVFTYTLDGFYYAGSTTLVSLTSTATIPYVYNKVNSNTQVNVVQSGGLTSNVDVLVSVIAGNDAVLFDQKSFSGKNADSNDEWNWTLDSYIERDKNSNASTYNGLGLKFKLVHNYSKNHYYFQNTPGSHKQAGYYASGGQGTFGFTASSATAHTSEVTEKDLKVDIGETKGSTAYQNFYGTVFKGSTTSTNPAQIIFTKMDCYTNSGMFNNSSYFNLTWNIWAYEKQPIRNKISSCTAKKYLSCYYDGTKYNEYCSMLDSGLRDAQIQLGLQMTNQCNITKATNRLNTAATELDKASSAVAGSYTIVHSMHNGDTTTPIEATSVDYYLYETSDSADLPLNSDYKNNYGCNKHTPVYTATMSSATTKTYTYEYWKINFSGMNDALSAFNELDPYVTFSNVTAAVGDELGVLTNYQQSTDTALPREQEEVDLAVNAFKKAERDLQYNYVEMTVTHTMYTPTGGSAIDDDRVIPVTKTYKKFTTYGKKVDGIDNIADGTFTIVGQPFSPQPDPEFMKYASDYDFSGVSTPYTVTEAKNIKIRYFAKLLENNQITAMVNEYRTQQSTWGSKYTADSIATYKAWYKANKDAGNFSRIYSVFDEQAYNEFVAVMQAERDKLDPLITQETIDKLNAFRGRYEVLQDYQKYICRSTELLAGFSDDYAEAADILALVDENNAGEHAADAILTHADKDLIIQRHVSLPTEILRAPLDGVPGYYNVPCEHCGASVGSDDFECPFFNRYTDSGYSYSNRAASLRVTGEDVDGDTQGLRFTASCEVPKGAEVEDFGFVWAYTQSLNGGKEPSNNNPVNVSALVDGRTGCHTCSFKNGKYTIHDEGENDIYTFNLLLVTPEAKWDTRYAARSYITYKLHGASVTVYDSSYSSRSVNYIAQCAYNNPAERSEVRAFMAEKFGVN